MIGLPLRYMPSRRSTTGGRASPEIQAAQSYGSENDTTSLLVLFKRKTQLVQGRLANVLLFLNNVGTRAILVAYYD